jgi:hypothetical protein
LPHFSSVVIPSHGYSIVYGKHLGIYFQNKIEGMKKDIKVKRAKFIERNNEIIQEYSFAHPKSKFKMNSIFNSHFTGSQVWDLFSQEAVMMENTWNKSIRLMFELPLQTHRYFICPISESTNVKGMLIKRFISFTGKLETSTKNAVKHLYKFVNKDAQSITGSNLRNIRLLLGKDDNQNLYPSDARDVKYLQAGVEDLWKINFLKELIEVKHGNLNTGLNNDEIEEIIEHLCTS